MLLDRLYKATPSKHEDKDAIKEAKEKIEDILGHINAVSYLSLCTCAFFVSPLNNFKSTVFLQLSGGGGGGGGGGVPPSRTI